MDKPSKEKKNLLILNTREIKEILTILKKQWGFNEKLNYVFLRNAKGKIYIVNKDINRIELEKMRIDSIGLYFGEQRNGTIRLSIEGSQMIGQYANKNLIELTEKETDEWLKGENITFKNKEGNAFVILKNGTDILGCGRHKEGKIHNYVPKERRLRVISK
jgi:NOL1/NOP2/fmu family ribosome biogenesis protein